MMTAYGTIESAVEAIKMGAYDYLTKPIIDEELQLVIERGVAQQTLLNENRRLKRELNMRYGLGSMVGHDYHMLKVFDLIEQVADSDVTVMLQGPSGTGKSLAAHVIHRLSPRRDKPFIEVAVGAIPEMLVESELFGHVRGAFTGAISNKVGKFKAADGGTIFLDEIATAPVALQVKLLRILQERQFEPVGSNTTEQVDVRVILATNVDLEAEVASGRFREDLFYRINVITIELPALCDRGADIALLAQFFLKQSHSAANKRQLLGFDDEATMLMQGYCWPGNVRELANVVQRCAVLAKGPYVGVGDLPAKLLKPEFHQDADAMVESPDALPPVETITSLREALQGPEKRILEAALKANHFNRQRTAKQLDINRTTLYKKMKRYGLDHEEAYSTA